jgi:hypothetical protein
MSVPLTKQGGHSPAAFWVPSTETPRPRLEGTPSSKEPEPPPLRRLGTNWEPPGLAGLSTAPFCSPVRGVHLRKHVSDLVVGIGMHGWGSRGRRFKSGCPDGFFERLCPKLGTKSAMIVPTCLRRHEQSIHGGDYTVLNDRVAATAEIPPARQAALGDLPTRQTRMGLDQHAIAEQLDQRRAGAGAQVPLRRRIHRPRSPRRGSHGGPHPGEHGALRTRQGVNTSSPPWRSS